MKKNLLFLLGILFLSSMVHAQEDKGSISGTVQEGDNTIAFATVILLDKDSALVKADYSKDDGSFTFVHIAPGKYRVNVRGIQYESYFSDFFDLKAGQALKLPTFQIKTAAQQLDDVQVTALKPLVDVQPDKTVFNVENSVNASGNDGMELLRKAPGIIIDNNDNITLQGKAGLQIYIDGKLSQLRGEDLTAYLRSLQSENIEAIEIVTNPSSKYDAAGNAGIINIKLKRDKNLGTNGTLFANYGYGQRSRAQAGGNFNYRNKKTNLFGSYTYYDNGGTNFNNFDKELMLNNLFFEQRSNNEWRAKGHNFRVGTDYFLHKKHTIGFIFNGNLGQNNGESMSRTPISNLDTRVVSQILDSDNISESENDNFNFNFNYQFTGGEGESFTLDADIGRYTRMENTNQPNIYMDAQEERIESVNILANNQDTQIDILTLKGDYERKLAQGKLGAGIKLASVETQNFFDFFSVVNSVEVLDTDRSNDFDYTERVTAAYINYSSAFGEKISFSGGLRMEHTESEGVLTSHKTTDNNAPVKRSYTDLFPSGGFTYQLNKFNKFGLNYSRRIDRPNYQDLNPFRDVLDELTFQEGNPFLNPQYTHSLQLTHTFHYKLNTQLSYSVTEDFFAEVIEPTEERGVLLKKRNLATSKNIGLNISYPFEVAKWWGVYANFSLFNQQFDAKGRVAQLNIDATTYNLFVQNNFNLPKGFKAEVSGWYNSPSVWGGTFEIDRMWSMNLGLKKSVLKDKGQLRVSLSDVFRTQVWTGSSDYNNVRFTGRGGNDSRRIKVGFTYRFGNNQVKAARNRKTGLEDEKSRIKD